MPYKYVDVEKTAIVLDENKLPIWEHDDGQTVGVNFASSLASIKDLSGKNKTFKTQIADFENKLKPFEGIDPEKARKDADMVLSIDEKKLIDAGERDSAVQNAIKARDEHFGSQISAYDKKISEFEQTILQKNTDIEEAVIKTAFANEPLFREKTILDPDAAYALFGRGYKAERVNGKLQAVAYDVEGNQIFSPADPSKPASFTESSNMKFNNYKYKDNYLKDTPGGPGARGGDGAPSGNKIILSKADQLNPLKFQAAQAEAAKSGKEVSFA